MTQIDKQCKILGHSEKILSKIRMLLATLQIEAKESLGPKRLKPAYQDPTYPKKKKKDRGEKALFKLYKGSPILYF